MVLIESTLGWVGVGQRNKSTRTVGRTISMELNRRKKWVNRQKVVHTGKRSLEKQDVSGFSSMGPGEGNIKCEDWEWPSHQRMFIVLQGKGYFTDVS